MDKDIFTYKGVQVEIEGSVIRHGQAGPLFTTTKIREEFWLDGPPGRTIERRKGPFKTKREVAKSTVDNSKRRMKYE